MNHQVSIRNPGRRTGDLRRRSCKHQSMMITTTRSIRSYDHRLRQLVHETGDTGRPPGEGFHAPPQGAGRSSRHARSCRCATKTRPWSSSSSRFTDYSDACGEPPQSSVQRGTIDDERRQLLLSWPHSGFGVYSDRVIEPGNRRAVERTIQHRASVFLERLTLTDLGTVTYTAVSSGDYAPEPVIVNPECRAQDRPREPCGGPLGLVAWPLETPMPSDRQIPPDWYTTTAEVPIRLELLQE